MFYIAPFHGELPSNMERMGVKKGSGLVSSGTYTYGNDMGSKVIDITTWDE